MRHWYWRAALAVLCGVIAGVAFNMGVHFLLSRTPGTIIVPRTLPSFVFLTFLGNLMVSGIVSVAMCHFLTLWWTRRQRAKLLRAGLCTNCGYDLTGNTSGVCPECGAPINP